MRRRKVLTGSVTIALAGCIINSTENAPGWLVQPSECDDLPLSLFDISDTTETPQPETVTVDYGDLKSDSRDIVDFALKYGAAATCDEDGRPAFYGLKSDIDELGLEEYISGEKRKYPTRVYIKKGKSHHPVRRFYHVDVTVIE